MFSLQNQRVTVFSPCEPISPRTCACLRSWRIGFSVIIKVQAPFPVKTPMWPMWCFGFGNSTDWNKLDPKLTTNEILFCKMVIVFLVAVNKKLEREILLRETLLGARLHSTFTLKCGLLEWSQFKLKQVLNYQKASSHMSDRQSDVKYSHFYRICKRICRMKLQSFTPKKEEYTPYKFTVDA